MAYSKEKGKCNNQQGRIGGEGNKMDMWEEVREEERGRKGEGEGGKEEMEGGREGGRDAPFCGTL